MAAGSSASFWFQLYMILDWAFMADLLDLAEKAKCPALIFTVDMPAVGRPGWAWGVGHVLELIAAEMKVAMTLTGVTRVDQRDRNALA